jgi:hypothetical protein
MEKKNIALQLHHAQQEYLNTLQRIKQGEETPNVDAFCNGMASETTISELIEKDAATAEDVEIGDGSIRRLLGSALGVAKKPIQPALDLGATGMAGTGAATAYLAYVLKRKMREQQNGDKYLDSDLPTKIELEPYR